METHRESKLGGISLSGYGSHCKAGRAVEIEPHVVIVDELGHYPASPAPGIHMICRRASASTLFTVFGHVSRQTGNGSGAAVA